jgi:hypothetical protein
VEELLRAAHRVAEALGHLARDLEREDPATRAHDRSVAGMLRQFAGQLQRAVEAEYPRPDAATRGRSHVVSTKKARVADADDPR